MCLNIIFKSQIKYSVFEHWSGLILFSQDLLGIDFFIDTVNKLWFCYLSRNDHP